MQFAAVDCYLLQQIVEAAVRRKMAVKNAAVLKAAVRREIAVKICSGSLATISAIQNGTNFKDLKENILIVLGCMDLDLWDRSNHMSLMIIKRDIPEVFRGAISEGITKAKDFFTGIEKRFLTNDKAKTSTLLQSLISMRYNDKGNIREYIMEMSKLASKLKALKLGLS
nr:PREDICTED: uncharacterized protein LOC108951870 [Musa acuminata subsp. malaccensis]